MSEFNFKSQICTTREQSERLLSLGLKKETADCGHFYGRQEHEEYEDWDTMILDDYGWESHWDVTDKEIPAWSLNRLICLLPSYIRIEDYEYGRKRIAALDLVIDSFLNVGYIEGVDEPCYDIHFYTNDVYTSICKAIEWLIKEGYFNKEYLV